MNFDLESGFCHHAVVYAPYISNGFAILDPRIPRWFNNAKNYAS